MSDEWLDNELVKPTVLPLVGFHFAFEMLGRIKNTTSNYWKLAMTENSEDSSRHQCLSMTCYR